MELKKLRIATFWTATAFIGVGSLVIAGAIYSRIFTVIVTIFVGLISLFIGFVTLCGVAVSTDKTFVEDMPKFYERITSKMRKLN